MGLPSSIGLDACNNSMAWFGSLCCRATAARIVGSQYLCTTVSKREFLVQFGGQLFCARSIACPRQGQRRHGPHIAVRGQF